MRNLAVALTVLLACMPCGAAPQAQSEVWQTFLSQVEVGTALTLRLQNGQRFHATLVAVQDDAVLVQPRTRVPVAVQPVAYDAIVSIERRRDGLPAGHAAAIGLGTGAAAFVTLLLVLMAAID